MIRRQVLQRTREEVPGRRKNQGKVPETEPSLSGSRDQKQVKVAWATHGRKREVGEKIREIGWTTFQLRPWRIETQTILLVFFEVQQPYLLGYQGES